MLPVQLVEYGEPLSVKSALGVDLSVAEQVEWYAAARQANAAFVKQLGARTPPLDIQIVPGDVFIRIVGAAGHLRLRSLSIEVLPKFAPDESSDRWQSALLRMLKLSRSRQFELASSINLASGTMSLLDQIGLSFADALLSASRNGPLLMYQRKASEASVLRGRLDIQAQFLQFRPHVVIGETDILDGDNPVTRLLAWAAEFLAGSVRLLRVRARIVEARTALGYVPAQRPSPLAAMRLRLSRAAAHYGDALAIARAVALSKPQTEGGGATPSYGVLFNTERAFELLVSSLLFRASIRIGTDVRTRPQRLETLAFALTDTVSPLAVRPDDQLVRGGSTLAAIDAKYKTNRGRGPSRPSEDDFRQALASAIATHSHTAFLVYPVAGDKAPDMLAWQVRLNAEETVTVHSIGLPLMSLADASGVESLTAVIVNAIQDSGALA